jgi:hypothetical protein
MGNIVSIFYRLFVVFTLHMCNGKVYPHVGPHISWWHAQSGKYSSARLFCVCG